MKPYSVVKNAFCSIACMLCAVAFTSVADAQVTEFTKIISTHSNGTAGNRQSSLPSVSADGTFIAFDSDATTLVGGDTNGDTDVFLHDRGKKTTIRVSVTTSGGQAQGASRSPAISANGRYVAFESYAQLDPVRDTNSAKDIYVYDRVTRAIELISLKSDGTISVFSNYEPSISGDGRFVAFHSDGALVPEANSLGNGRVYLYDRQSNSLTWVSKLLDLGNVVFESSQSRYASISGNGRYVVYESDSKNIVENDSNGKVSDIFLYDRITGTNSIVSKRPDGSQWDGASFAPFISNNGNVIAYENVLPNARAIFVYERDSDTTTAESFNLSGDIISAEYPTLSNDGRYVTFHTSERDVVSEHLLFTNVYLRDRVLGTTFLVSRGLLANRNINVNSNSLAAFGMINANATMVAFDGGSDSFLDEDTNSWQDVFVAEGNRICNENRTNCLDNSRFRMSIMANDAHSYLEVYDHTLTKIRVSMNAGERAGQIAEHFLIVITRFGILSYNFNTRSWDFGIFPGKTGPIEDVHSELALQVLGRQLPAGPYDFYYAVDNTLDNFLTFGDPGFRFAGVNTIFY